MDGQNLDMSALLKEFQRFWRENAEIWTERYEYKEAAPHLILQAFLQRVTNGGAQIVREFALGTGRVDVCVHYAGKAYPLELKLASSKAIRGGLEQLDRYMDSCGAAEGWLVIFDRDNSKARTAGSAEGRSESGFAARSDAIKTGSAEGRSEPGPRSRRSDAVKISWATEKLPSGKTAHVVGC
jgi:hypothetical protein